MHPLAGAGAERRDGDRIHYLAVYPTDQSTGRAQVQEGSAMSDIQIIGGGFAGVWAAASAAKLRDECMIPEQDLSITLVTAGDDLVIRPRLYEASPHEMRVPLDAVLGPIGVRRVAATVTHIAPVQRQVTAVTRDGQTSTLSYDRLVLATGSQVVRPQLPGADYLFNVDTLHGAAKLDSHLQRLPRLPATKGRFTVVVVGAGFTGLEIATELTGRLSAIAGPGTETRVVLVEREHVVGPELGEGPRPVILRALNELGVETRLGTTISRVEPDRVQLDDGSSIETSTVIWTAGMVASPLTSFISTARDPLGRLHVDPYLRVDGVEGVFAAGDTAAALATEGRTVMQSCQHALPQGKFVGHNAAADLLGRPLVPFEPVPYVTCLDLGPAGAVVTSGWERTVLMSGQDGKALKRTINADWIYPPLHDATALFSLAGPQPEWPEYRPEAAEPVGFGRA